MSIFYVIVVDQLAYLPSPTGTRVCLTGHLLFLEPQSVLFERTDPARYGYCAFSKATLRDSALRTARPLEREGAGAVRGVSVPVDYATLKPGCGPLP